MGPCHRSRPGHRPSRATTRPALTTQDRGGRIATSSPSVLPGESRRRRGHRRRAHIPRAPEPLRLRASPCRARRAGDRRSGSRCDRRAAWRARACPPCRTASRHRARHPIGEHRHTGRAEAAKRRHRPVPRRIGHDGDAAVHEQVDEVAQLGLVHHAEAKRVADRDLAREPQGPRALGDHANLKRAELARVVQMDVHARAMAPGDAEDDVELPLFGSRSMPAGSMPPISSAPPGTARSRSSAVPGTGDDPALGKGDDLDRHDVFQPASRRHDPFEVPQADLGVDVHVAADVQRPAAHRLAGQAFGLISGARPSSRRRRRSLLDAVEHRGPRLVRAPRQTPERLVEMHVRVDEAGQQDAVLPVHHLGAGRPGDPGPTRAMTPSVASTSTATPAMAARSG